MPLKHGCGTILAGELLFNTKHARGQTAAAKYERQPERWEETSKMFLK